MGGRCKGLVKSRVTGKLVRCGYEATASHWCYVHSKVASGDITDMSWTPNRNGHPPANPEVLEILVAEWDLR